MNLYDFFPWYLFNNMKIEFDEKRHQAIHKWLEKQYLRTITIIIIEMSCLWQFISNFITENWFTAFGAIYLWNTLNTVVLIVQMDLIQENNNVLVVWDQSFDPNSINVDEIKATKKATIQFENIDRISLGATVRSLLIYCVLQMQLRYVSKTITCFSCRFQHGRNTRQNCLQCHRSENCWFVCTLAETVETTGLSFDTSSGW